MTSKVIICNGGYRTGSTLLFNMVREVLTQGGIAYQSFGASDDWANRIINQPPSHEWYVLKIHDFVPHVWPNVRIVHVRRDYRQVAASVLMLMKSRYGVDKLDAATTEDMFTRFHRQEKVYQAIKHRDDTISINYNSIYHRPEIVCSIISGHFEIILTPDRIKDILEACSIDSTLDICSTLDDQAADMKTEYRSDHISSRKGDPDAWREVLPANIIKRIEDEFNLR